MARASSSSTSRSLSMACGSSGGAVVFIRLSEREPLHREGGFDGTNNSSRAAASQGEKGGRCFLTHGRMPSACWTRRSRPQFLYARPCRDPRCCCHSLWRIPLLSEENANHGSRRSFHTGDQPYGRAQRLAPDRSGGTRLHRVERPLHLAGRTHLLPFAVHDPHRTRRLFLFRRMLRWRLHRDRTARSGFRRVPCPIPQSCHRRNHAGSRDQLTIQRGGSSRLARSKPDALSNFRELFPLSPRTFPWQWFPHKAAPERRTEEGAHYGRRYHRPCGRGYVVGD